MDISEVRALSDKDLEGALRDAKQELWKVRFDLATRQESNSSAWSTRRTDVSPAPGDSSRRRRGSRDRSAPG